MRSSIGGVIIGSITIIILGLAAYAGNKKTASCNIPGEAIHWRADYCLWLNETGDFNADSVQKCFYGKLATDKKQGMSDCDKKRFYREEICRSMIGMYIFRGSMEKCMKSDETIPATVEKDGV